MKSVSGIMANIGNNNVMQTFGVDSAKQCFQLLGEDCWMLGGVCPEKATWQKSAQIDDVWQTSGGVLRRPP